jgi:hypothetical protein
MKKMIMLTMTLGIAAYMTALAKPYEEFHSEAEESRWVAFVEAHPEMDFASYRMREDVTNGMQLISFAAGRNYDRLLTVMEQRGGAIRRHVVQDNTASPLALALMFEADEAVEVLLKIRPEWANRFDPFLGSVPVYVPMAKTDVPGVKRLLDHGADADSVDGLTGQSLLQNAALRSLEMYELVRRQGGRQNQSRHLFQWKPEIRAALIEKNMPLASSVYPDKIVFASGVGVDYPRVETATNAFGQERVLLSPLPQEAVVVLKHELGVVGLKGSGTLIMKCYGDSYNGLARWIEPLLSELNLAAIYVHEYGRPSSPKTPGSYVPTIQKASPE